MICLSSTPTFSQNKLNADPVDTANKTSVALHTHIFPLIHGHVANLCDGPISPPQLASINRITVIFNCPFTMRYHNGTNGFGQANIYGCVYMYVCVCTRVLLEGTACYRGYSDLSEKAERLFVINNSLSNNFISIHSTWWTIWLDTNTNTPSFNMNKHSLQHPQYIITIILTNSMWLCCKS